MTTYPPVLISKHLTLAANAVDTVTVQRPNAEVKNRGSVALYVRADGIAPTVGGDDSYVVLPGESYNVAGVKASSTVQVIASAPCDYSVTGS